MDPTQPLTLTLTSTRSQTGSETGQKCAFEVLYFPTYGPPLVSLAYSTEYKSPGHVHPKAL